MTTISDLAFILEHAHDNPQELLLHPNRYPGVQLSWCVSQIEARKKIRNKLPSWYAIPELHYPTGLSLEQASSETTALYKARLISRTFSTSTGRSTNTCTSADLTGGLGIDTSFLARQVHRHHYFERQPALCEAARHNFALLGMEDRIQVHEQELSESDLKTVLSGVDIIYLDPARRSQSGGRIFSIADCEPNVLAWKRTLLQQARQVWVKLSPMIDLTATLKTLPETRSVTILSVNNEVKELLLLLSESESYPDSTSKTGPLPAEEVPIHCVRLHPTNGEPLHTFTCSLGQEQAAAPNSLQAPSALHTLDGYLMDPDKAILKAGAFKSIARHYPVTQCAIHAHLYHAPAPVPDFPGRTFRIVRTWEFNKRSIAELQKLLPDARANVTARHFPLTSDALQQKLKLKNGDRFHVFATTLDDRRKLLLLTTPLGE